MKTRPPPIHSDWPKVRVLINNNYCVRKSGLIEMYESTEMFLDSSLTLNENCFAVSHVLFVTE